jgi:hypothetical protein
VGFSGIIQDPFRHSGLARIDVGHDANISDLCQGLFLRHCYISISLNNCEIVPATAANQMVFDTVLPGHCQENSLQNPGWFNKITFLNQTTYLGYP